MLRGRSCTTIVMAGYKTIVAELLTRMVRFDAVGGHLVPLTQWYEHGSSYYKQYRGFPKNPISLALERPHMVDPAV